MLREHNKIVTSIHKTLDLLLVALSFIAAYLIKRTLLPGDLGGLSTTPNYYLVLLAVLVVASFSFRFAGFYQSYRKQTFLQISVKIVKAAFFILIGLTFSLYILHEQGVSRLLLFLFSGILVCMLLLTKGLVYYTLRYYRSREYNTRNVLIIGTGERAKNITNALQEESDSGYKIAGYIDPFNDRNKKHHTIQQECLGSLNNLPTILIEKVIDEIIFATDIDHLDFINEHISFAEELGINVRIVPDFHLQKILYRPATARVFMEEFAGIPTLALSTVPQNTGELFIKSCMDYICAGIGLLVLSPLFTIISMLVKITSKGPIFFLQERCGLYGRTFKLIKFRTMVVNAEALKKELEHHNEMNGPVFKMANDPRITPLGKFLRKSSLDELPQLINILMGQMSLVGPRPPLPSEVQQYDSWQRRRLSMKPGITGLWQVSGRNNIDFERWMRLDLEYIDNWSLLLDCKILLKTVKEVLSFHGK